MTFWWSKINFNPLLKISVDITSKYLEKYWKPPPAESVQSRWSSSLPAYTERAAWGCCYWQPDSLCDAPGLQPDHSTSPAPQSWSPCPGDHTAPVGLCWPAQKEIKISSSNSSTVRTQQWFQCTEILKSISPKLLPNSIGFNSEKWHY